MTEHLLTGLDGSNPLGFMAALGALRVVSEKERFARLSWRDDGRWRPVLEIETSADPAALICEDLATWRDAPELGLEYEKQEKNKVKKVRDLKPPPDVFRRFLEGAAGKARPDCRRLADFAAAYGSEAIQDNNGNTKPTALHFTAGQQSFLDMVVEIAAGLKPELIDEALYGPWRYEGELPLLRWDVAGERLYALMASNPGTEKARGVPGADWLAFQALPLFPSFPVGSRLETTAFRRERRVMALRWPLWTVPAGMQTIRSLLCTDVARSDRVARGVAVVFEAPVRRSDRGYATFSAPTVV